MEVVYPRCCGIDVHKRTVTACRVLPGPDGRPVPEVRTFETMTPDLLALSDWLAAGGVTHVAMESTGVYWKPLWNLLEEQFTLLLVNAQHIKAVPGRKTDVTDAEWIADLLRHGLLRGSFVPDRPLRELRELTRYRSSLVHARTAEVNRLQKTLEGRQHQTGERGQRRDRGQCARDAGRAGGRQRRGRRPGQTGRGASCATRQAELERALTGRMARASALHARPAPGPDRHAGCADRRGQRGDCPAARPF